MPPTFYKTCLLVENAYSRDGKVHFLNQLLEMHEAETSGVFPDLFPFIQ